MIPEEAKKQRLRVAGVVIFLGGGAVILAAFAVGSGIAEIITRIFGG